MTYQQCRYKNQVKEIPVREIHEQCYIFLEDVHDHFPGVRSFICNGKPIPFEVDAHHVRLVPARVRAFTKEIIDCHKPEYDEESPSEINDIKQKISEISYDVKRIEKNTEILKDKADVILRQTFQLSEFTVPRIFIVLPEYTSLYNPAHWFRLNYRLYFLCECEDDNGPHLAFHEGYEIKQPREFFRKYGPYLRNMLTVVSCTIPACKLIVPELKSIDLEIPKSVNPQDLNFWNSLSYGIEQLNEILTKVEESENIPPISRNFQYREGVELREIQSFLKKLDVDQTLGNLYRSVTKDGNVRWVCHQHYKQCYSEGVIKGLREEFQKLGGEITQDTVLIGEQALNNFSKMVSLIKKGLQISSIILKNLDIKARDFDELLSYVSKQSVIRNLKIENITVLSNPVNIRKRVIISKLNETVVANDKLSIEYSFTKPLSEFQQDTIHAMTETNSRLIFRVRSREVTHSLELVRAKETGFTLSINNSDEKHDRSYHTAIQTIFQKTPNINKILLHNGVISESIWTSFYQFLKTSQTLHELTVDCRLTLDQTNELSLSLSNNKTLKALHLLNVWKRNDDSDSSTGWNGWESLSQHFDSLSQHFDSLSQHFDSLTQHFDSPTLNHTVDSMKTYMGKNILVKTFSKNFNRSSEKQNLDKSLNDQLNGSKIIFEMLHTNSALAEVTLTCDTVLLQFDLTVKCLLENKYLRILRLPKCEIHQNTDIKLCESFLRNTSIHTLSLDFISTNCDAFLERLARAIDDNGIIETLELKGLDSSAIFHRKNHIPDTENNLARLSSLPTNINSSRIKPKQFLNMLSYADDKHRRCSVEEIIPPPVVSTQENNSKHISIEPFYTLCNHPSLYKQMQEIAQNFKLEKLQVTIGDDVKMTDVALSMKSNLTVTELRIRKRMLTVKDIQMLIEALRNNITITHLNLNKINILINYIRQIFDVLRENQTLRVLEVKHCISRFDRDEFIKEIKTLEVDNPSLKVVYENE